MITTATNMHKIALETDFMMQEEKKNMKHEEDVMDVFEFIIIIIKEY